MTNQDVREGLLQVGDFIPKDGQTVRVESIREVAGDMVLYTSDGGCMGADEVCFDDIRLESEVRA